MNYTAKLENYLKFQASFLVSKSNDLTDSCNVFESKTIKVSIAVSSKKLYQDYVIDFGVIRDILNGILNSINNKYVVYSNSILFKDKIFKEEKFFLINQESSSIKSEKVSLFYLLESIFDLFEQQLIKEHKDIIEYHKEIEVELSLTDDSMLYSLRRIISI